MIGTRMAYGKAKEVTDLFEEFTKNHPITKENAREWRFFTQLVMARCKRIDEVAERLEKRRLK